MTVAQVSAKHKVFAVPFDPALYNVVPGCKILGDQVVVPHTIDTTRLARNLGYRVPAPIRARYDWAGGAPFEAQEVTAALMTMNLRGVHPLGDRHRQDPRGTVRDRLSPARGRDQIRPRDCAALDALPGLGQRDLPVLPAPDDPGPARHPRAAPQARSPSRPTSTSSTTTASRPSRRSYAQKTILGRS